MVLLLSDRSDSNRTVRWCCYYLTDQIQTAPSDGVATIWQIRFKLHRQMVLLLSDRSDPSCTIRRCCYYFISWLFSLWSEISLFERSSSQDHAITNQSIINVSHICIYLTNDLIDLPKWAVSSMCSDNSLTIIPSPALYTVFPFAVSVFFLSAVTTWVWTISQISTIAFFIIFYYIVATESLVRR